LEHRQILKRARRDRCGFASSLKTFIAAESRLENSKTFGCVDDGGGQLQNVLMALRERTDATGEEKNNVSWYRKTDPRDKGEQSGNKDENSTVSELGASLVNDHQAAQVPG